MLVVMVTVQQFILLEAETYKLCCRNGVTLL